MRSLILLGLGILIGAAALGAALAAHHGDVTVRATLVRHDDGRVEVGLQQQGADGAWHELEGPEARFLSPDAEAGTTYHSSEVVIPVETSAERIAADYRERLYGEGVDLVQYYLPEAEEGEEPDLSALGPVICVVDTQDSGIEALCDGLEAEYPGEIERVEISDPQALHAHMLARFNDGAPIGGLMTTSVATTHIAIDAWLNSEDDSDWKLVYWIELVDPLLPEPDALFCVVGHGGAEQDLFWGIAGEVQATAGDALNLNLRSEAHAEVADQIAGVQQCVDDGAAAIATTLPDPAALQPAIEEAQAAGIAVTSFNSGGEAASEAGVALHIGLDDRQAGRIAGDELNAREISGNVICVIHEESNVGLEERCDGLEERFTGTVERLRVYSPEWMEQVAKIIERLDEGDADAIISLSTDSATNVLYAQWRGGTQIPHAAFGFSLSIALRVANGQMLFTVLDHPEIQSYFASASALMVDRFRVDPYLYFNGMSVLIQPMIAGAEQMQAILADLEGAYGQ